MNYIIRPEKDSDQEQIYNLVQAAFENAEYADHDEHNLVNRLRNSDAFIPKLSLVAERNDQIMGYVLFTEVTIGNDIAIGLAPVAVLPEFHGKGVGSMLIKEGHNLAKRLGYSGSIVLGNPAYYRRFGYVPASNYKIAPPFEVPDEYFMAKELKEEGLADVNGTVKYAKEFFVN